MADAVKKALYDRMLEEQDAFAKEHPFVTYDNGATGDAMSVIDSVTGAPFRAAIGQMQEGNFGEALKSYKDQFGSDPGQAPSMEDIAIKAGVPKGNWSKAAGILGSMAEPGIPFIKGSVKTKLPQIKPGEAKIVSSPAYRESFETALEQMKSKPPVKADIIRSGKVEKFDRVPADTLMLENKLEELKAMKNKVSEQLNRNKETFSNKKVLAQYDNLDKQIKELEAQLKEK